MKLILKTSILYFILLGLFSCNLFNSDRTYIPPIESQKKQEDCYEKISPDTVRLLPECIPTSGKTRKVKQDNKPNNANGQDRGTQTNKSQTNRPYLVLPTSGTLVDLTRILVFTMPSRNGHLERETIGIKTKVITATRKMKFSDVKTPVQADNEPHSLPLTYNNDDGDTVSINAVMTATWKDKDGNIISAKDLDSRLRLENSPYTLSLDVKHSKDYDDQNDSKPLKIYTFIVKSDPATIAYIKPASMKVFSSGKKYIKFSEGYNPEVWEVSKGFSVEKMKMARKYFPTTGFNGAEFDIIGSGDDQSDYRCRLTYGSWIILSGPASQDLGQNCHVTYNTTNKPTSHATIILEQLLDDNWVKIDDYTINIPQKWAILLDKKYSYADNYLADATIFPALDACRKVGLRADHEITIWTEGAGKNPEDKEIRQQFMYRRNELTNSPHADPIIYPEGIAQDYIASFFSRDIDSTFMGEWGILSNYRKSGWASDSWAPGRWYWTAEVYRYRGSQSGVEEDGSIGWIIPQTKLSTVCRGE